MFDQVLQDIFVNAYFYIGCYILLIAYVLGNNIKIIDKLIGSNMVFNLICVIFPAMYIYSPDISIILFILLLKHIHLKFVKKEEFQEQFIELGENNVNDIHDNNINNETNDFNDEEYNNKYFQNNYTMLNS